MFKGVYTAMVTPFNEDGMVDYGRLRTFLEEQVAAGVAGVVPVGTTGESPTLDHHEHLKVIEATAEIVAKRIQVIAGTGANSTAEAIELTREVLPMGVDATLQVTPYYNKPSSEGLYRHFSTIADLGLPVVLYNVPGRASKEIPLDVVARLSTHEAIVAIKEAAGSVDRVSAIRAACGLEVLSGDDSLALAMMAVGAKGVISVASNVIPSEMVQLCALAAENRFAEALSIHDRYYHLFRDLFIETNPVPVKAALALMGKMPEVYRLPLCELAPVNREKLAATMRSAQIIQ
ncbi:MAG: 4-hydroxy-tetrahydrodipicolinate synthase [Kiritimatiellia bacterium]|nr:4-hydroxy-tetrahydrodipicolinate synthase [Kiritimatiellia bacterium]